jgi:intein/homing endonuclease
MGKDGKSIYDKYNIEDTPDLPSNHYFDNTKVEKLLIEYHKTGCTDVRLRDEIMSHAHDLIINVIRTHNLHTIYGGREESSFNDLYQLSWVQIESTLYKFDSSPGHSKIFNMWCASPSTMVLTNHGIRELVDVSMGADVRISGLESEPSNVIAGLVRPETNIIHIETQYGYSIDCTPEHPILCIKDGDIDFVCAGDICEDHLVAIQYGQDVYANMNDISDIELSYRGDWVPPKTITPELAYLLGLYIAEGSHSYGKLVIYNTDKEIIDALVNNTLKLNFIHEPQYQRVSLCNKRFIEFLSAMGLDKLKCNQKFIPHRLLSMSKDNVQSMLRGLFDGDGHSSRHNGHVGYTSTSKKLIDQVRMLLLNMGMLSKLSIDTRNNSTFVEVDRAYDSHKLTTYRLMLPTPDSKTFYDTIGFNIQRKQQKSEALGAGKKFIYAIRDRFNKLHKKYKGCTWDDLGSVTRNRSKLSLDNAQTKLALFSEHNHDEDYVFIESRIDELTRNRNNIMWLPVRQLCTGKSRVCEISVDSDTHSYISNGMISHNSQISRTVILAAIKKDGRDKKNAENYRHYLDETTVKLSVEFERFMKEAEEICKYSEDDTKLLEMLKELYHVDSKPYEGLIGKLVEMSGMSRSKVLKFMKRLRVLSFELTDSPRGEIEHQEQPVKPSTIAWNVEEE